MKPSNQTTQEKRELPGHPDFSSDSALIAARIERGRLVHAVIVDLFARIGRGLIAPFASLRRRQREYDELMSLDDHILADIEITRSDIPYLIDESANQGKTGNDNSAKAA